jgi:hypothetical protein
VRRTAARVAGIALLAAGIVLAVTLWLIGERRYDEAVAALAPAPLGCTTTLRFEEPGTYTFFVETKGEVGELAGDCDHDDRRYDLDAAPRVVLRLERGDGREVDLDRAVGPTYDRAGQRGAAVRVAEITERGEYRLTATAASGEASEAVVRVGRDPARGVTALRVTGVMTFAVGVIGGLVLLALVWRRPQPAAAPSAPAPWPDPAFGPRPVAPPLAERPTSPRYVPRPPSYGLAPSAPPPSDGRPPHGRPDRGGPLPPPMPPRA